MLRGAAARRVALLAGKGGDDITRQISGANVTYSKTPGPNAIKNELNTGI